MKIKIKNEENIINLIRKIGYHFDRRSSSENPSFSRPIGGGKFPRFHIYYDPKKNLLNLHLDQKAPRYSSANDHGAEYSGPVVEKEAERIKNIID